MSRVQTREAGFERDTNSKALLNNRKDSFDAYKRKRASQMASSNEIDELKEEILNLKDMLTKLMDKNNG